MRWECLGRTDPGLVRDHNEDAFLVLPDLGVFAVADGMGGHAAGEVASAIAIEALRADVVADHSIRHGDRRTAEMLAGAARKANSLILERARRDAETAGMGTTLTALAIVPRDRSGVIVHTGDSRAYRLRDTELLQLTHDQSWVQTLIDAGRLTEQEALSHPFRSTLEAALGTAAVPDLDTVQTGLTPGDLLLLCSDGLTATMDNRELRTRLVAGAASDLADLACALIAAANGYGGPDNITVVLARLL
jgi:PPM family protein phosphatase